MTTRNSKQTSSKRTLLPSEKALLRKISNKIRAELAIREDLTVELLAADSEIAISTLRAILDASSPKLGLGLITLERIAKALKYKGAADFLKNL